MGANRKGLLITLIGMTSLLIGLQLGSGVWLFVHKLTFSPDHIAAAYLGDADAFIAGKTVIGVLQTALPHTVAMGSVALLLGHLLPYCGMGPRIVRTVSAAVMAGAIGEIAAPFLILTVSPLFAWGKLFSFVVFESAIGIALVAVLIAAAKRH